MCAILLCLMLAGCASHNLRDSYAHGDLDKDGCIAYRCKVYCRDDATKAQVEAFAAGSLDDGERAAFKALLWGNAADVASTGLMLNAGCAEANKLMRNPLALVGLKVLWLAWWRDAAAQSPEGFSHAGDEKFAYVFYGASIINLRAATNGCNLW